MKILTSRKNKDYYDYLTGIYGIDEKVVFDRRQFTVLTSLDSPFFNYQRNERDKQKRRNVQGNGLVVSVSGLQNMSEPSFIVCLKLD